MRTIQLSLTTLFCLLLINTAIAQKWQTEIASGLDFSGLLQINPKAGAGDSQIGIGGAFSINANYIGARRDRKSWQNSFSVNYGVQKTGFGTVGNTEIEAPFTKSVDQIRLNSKFGYRLYRTSPGYKFLLTADFSFLSQLSKTYEGNFISEPNAMLTDGKIRPPISNFLSPATTYFSLGMDYQVSDQLSVYLSPGAVKAIIVKDDEIAQQSTQIDDDRQLVAIHGNPLETETVIDGNGNVLLFPKSYQNVDFQFGSLLRITYKDAYLNDHLFVNSNFSAYSNYLRDPHRIDIDWVNEIGAKIAGGFSVSLWTNLFYDYDVPVQKTENFRLIDEEYKRGVSFSAQLLIKYSRTFGDKNSY
jgi:hypothetical protein